MKRNMRLLVFTLLLVISFITSGCVREQPQIVVITATFTPGGVLFPAANDTPAATFPVFEPSTSPTPDPTRSVNNLTGAQEYIVQPGDTLSNIADVNGVSLESLLNVNNIPDPNVLSVGQVIILPEAPSQETASFKILPDSRLVRGPGSTAFDVVGFIAQQPGYIRIATDTVDDQLLTGAQVVQRVSLEFSVDARLLLALLEYRGRWLTQLNLDDAAKTYPIQGAPSSDGIDRSGLYRQLAWTANQLNRGYYGWKYRGLSTVELDDGTRLLYANGLNAGTVGVQYFLSLNTLYSTWASQVSQDGFYRVYSAYFGDPFQDAVDPLVPIGLVQPEMSFPFTAGQVWFFTGGPHGGWGAGSAWSAIDFAPPDDRPDGSSPCYVSDFWATAVAPGVIARSGGGVVILDLDGDGDESTGWSILYLHMASDGRVEAGKRVSPGDLIGRPSCEGGFSNGTHMHIARRYNGEWLPVYCEVCTIGDETPPFVMSGWTVLGFPNQEYQGYMVNNGQQRTAEQGRLTPDNRVSW